MPVMTVLLLALLAHFIADFVLQTSSTIDRKNKFRLSGYLIHGLIYLLVTIAFLHYLQLGAVIAFSLIVTFLHILIDYLKCRLSQRRSKRLDLAGFFLDQLFHLGSIFWLWQVFDWRPNTRIIAIYYHLVSPKTIAVFNQTVKTPRLSPDHLLMALIIYVVVAWGGAVLVRKILNAIDGVADRDASSQRAGYYIGLLERVIILTLVLFDGLGSIAFILTAKSIARFSELNNKKFAEYYLIGTLLSTILAIGGGLLFKFVTRII